MDDKDEVHNLELADGCFCVMAGAMQQKYLHGIPVGDRGLRFNLTFRQCIPRGSVVHGGDMKRPPPTAQQARIDAAARESSKVAAPNKECEVSCDTSSAASVARRDAASGGYGAQPD